MKAYKRTIKNQYLVKFIETLETICRTKVEDYNKNLISLKMVHEFTEIQLIYRITNAKGSLYLKAFSSGKCYIQQRMTSDKITADKLTQIHAKIIEVIISKSEQDYYFYIRRKLSEWDEKLTNLSVFEKTILNLETEFEHYFAKSKTAVEKWKGNSSLEPLRFYSPVYQFVNNLLSYSTFYKKFSPTLERTIYTKKGKFVGVDKEVILLMKNEQVFIHCILQQKHKTPFTHGLSTGDWEVLKIEGNNSYEGLAENIEPEDYTFATNFTISIRGINKHFEPFQEVNRLSTIPNYGEKALTEEMLKEKLTEIKEYLLPNTLRK